MPNEGSPSSYNPLLRVTCTTFEAYLGVSLPHGPVRCLSGRGEIPTRREIKCASPKVPKNRKVTQGLAKNTSLHNAHEHSLFVFRFHCSYSAFTTCCRSADTPILWCDLKLVRRCGALVSAVPSTRYNIRRPQQDPKAQGFVASISVSALRHHIWGFGRAPNSFSVRNKPFKYDALLPLYWSK